MFGFVVGFLCLIGLVKVLRAGRGHGRCAYGGCGPSYGRRGWGPPSGPWAPPPPPGGWAGGWAGRGLEGRPLDRAALRWIYRELDTTPGQEKVIAQAFDEVRAAVETVRTELGDSRREIAQAVRSGNVDETQMGELYARHDEKLRTMRTAFFGALAKVTEALDETQRARLAELLDQGSLHDFAGPYRG